jgi:hypothetical protein
MKSLVKLLSVMLLPLIISSCNQDDEILPNSVNNGNGALNSQPFLTFQMDGQAYNLNSSNGITSIPLLLALSQNAANAATGMSFKNSTWPATDRVFFQVVLPIDSTGLSTFTYDEPFIINNSQLGPFMGVSVFMLEYLYPGTIVVQWDSSNGNLDGLREYNEDDNVTYYNSITSIEYAGNHHYDTMENLWKCDYLITGNFEMRLQNENNGEIKVVSSGQYSMIADVLAE